MSQPVASHPILARLPDGTPPLSLCIADGLQHIDPFAEKRMFAATR